MESDGFAPNTTGDENRSALDWHDEAVRAAPVAAAAAGRAVAATQADDRHLIALVRARPALYVRNSMPAARAQVLQKRLWHEVANGMGWSVEEARRKWSHVRNSYSRHLRNEVLGSRTNSGRVVTRWYLADELAFLRDHMATDTRSSLSSYPRAPPVPASASDATEDMDVKPFSLTNDSWTESCGSEMSASSPTTVSYNESTADDGAVYMEFFGGLYGEYSTLSPSRRRRFKRRCLSALHRLLDEQETPPEAGAANSSSDDETRPRPAQPLCVLTTTVDSTQQLHSNT